VLIGAGGFAQHALGQMQNLLVRRRGGHAFDLGDGAEALCEFETHGSRGEISDPLRQRFKLRGSVYVVARRVHACLKRGFCHLPAEEVTRPGLGVESSICDEKGAAITHFTPIAYSHCRDPFFAGMRALNSLN
jgi:hypothetical protein